MACTMPDTPVGRASSLGFVADAMQHLDQFVGLHRLGQEILGAGANGQAHGLGVAGRADHDQWRARRTAPGRRPLGQFRQMLGIEPQNDDIRLKRQPVQRIRVAVADQAGMHFELLCSFRHSCSS